MRTIILIALVTAMNSHAVAQPQDANYDEANVPQYTLPDPLRFSDGSPVSSADEWRQRRRGEILALFEEFVYGRAPEAPPEMHFETSSVQSDVFGGSATRKEVSIYFTEGISGPHLDLLIYVPNEVDGAVPAFLGLNFFGNQTVYPDSGITISEGWMMDAPAIGIEDHRATPESRGARTGRWPVELILSRGYGLVTAYYGDIDPDYDDGFGNGVHPLFYREGQTSPASDEWGSIAAWAWGLSRALDYLETDPDLDARRVAVMGHSRLGKTALWAGARDERFALTISNNSGAGGAAISRRRFGETVKRITTSFPHWFADNFDQFGDAEDELPVDQHMLIALIAPRPAYIASAAADLWADPRGEFLSVLHAHPVYRLLGQEGLPADSMPELNRPVTGTLGYHIRPGTHDVTIYDWHRFLDFADRHLK